MALSEKCNAAFKRYGRPSPDELVQKGLTFGSTRALTSPAYDNELGISDTDRLKFLGKASGAAGLTIRGNATGRPIVLLSPDAFGANYDLQDVLSHEFIHAGGIDVMWGFWGSLSHDLAGFPGYDDILKSCR